MRFITAAPDVIGVIGVVMILLAYYQSNTFKVTPHHVGYQLLNLIGSLAILFSLLFNWNTPAAIIEIAWILISLLGLYKAVQHRMKSK